MAEPEALLPCPWAAAPVGPRLCKPKGIGAHWAGLSSISGQEERKLPLGGSPSRLICKREEPWYPAHRAVGRIKRVCQAPLLVSALWGGPLSHSRVCPGHH